MTVTASPARSPSAQCSGDAQHDVLPGGVSGPAPTSLLAGRQVIVADLGGRRLGAVSRALACAGASVRQVTGLPEARRDAALLGSTAALVLDATGRTRQVHTALATLGRQRGVVLLSAASTPHERIDLLHAGADRVLITMDPDEVVAVLTAVLRRVRDDVPALPTQWQCGQLVVELATRTAVDAGRNLGLTALEFDLLAYFMCHVDQVLSRQRLLSDVWGHDIGGLDTVTVHVRRLRMKIEADPSSPLVLQTVWGIGYRLVPEVFGAVADLSPPTAPIGS